MSELSWPLRRFLMAEIDNEIPDDGEEHDWQDYGATPATLQTAHESLMSGYEPFDGFEEKHGDQVQAELEALIAQHGSNTPATNFITDADWIRRSQSTQQTAG